MWRPRACSGLWQLDSQGPGSSGLRASSHSCHPPPEPGPCLLAQSGSVTNTAQVTPTDPLQVCLNPEVGCKRPRPPCRGLLLLQPLSSIEKRGRVCSEFPIFRVRIILKSPGCMGCTCPLAAAHPRSVPAQPLRTALSRRAASPAGAPVATSAASRRSCRCWRLKACFPPSRSSWTGSGPTRSSSSCVRRCGSGASGGRGGGPREVPAPQELVPGTCFVLGPYPSYGERVRHDLCLERLWPGPRHDLAASLPLRVHSAGRRACREQAW